MCISGHFEQIKLIDWLIDSKYEQTLTYVVGDSDGEDLDAKCFRQVGFGLRSFDLPIGLPVRYQYSHSRNVRSRMNQTLSSCHAEALRRSYNKLNASV